MKEPPTRAPAAPPRRHSPSLVLVHTGDGKGKTTAAMGILLRAVARGWSACVIQFVKSGEWRAGEEEIARRLGVEWWTLGDGFTWESDLETGRAVAERAWEAAREAIGSGRYDLVVLDEVTYPIAWGWIDGDDVARALRERPKHVNVVATGRGAPDALLDVADTVTEMVNVRHAFDRGVAARRGIDY